MSIHVQYSTHVHTYSVYHLHYTCTVQHILTYIRTVCTTCTVQWALHAQLFPLPVYYRALRTSCRVLQISITNWVTCNVIHSFCVGASCNIQQTWEWLHAGHSRECALLVRTNGWLLKWRYVHLTVKEWVQHVSTRESSQMLLVLIRQLVDCKL